MIGRPDNEAEGSMAKKLDKKVERTDLVVREGANPIALKDSDLQQQIAKKAFELFLRRGAAHGHDIEDWLEAERMITVELRISPRRP